MEHINLNKTNDIKEKGIGMENKKEIVISDKEQVRFWLNKLINRWNIMNIQAGEVKEAINVLVSLAGKLLEDDKGEEE